MINLNNSAGKIFAVKQKHILEVFLKENRTVMYISPENEYSHIKNLSYEEKTNPFEIEP